MWMFANRDYNAMNILTGLAAIAKIFDFVKEHKNKWWIVPIAILALLFGLEHKKYTDLSLRFSFEIQNGDKEIKKLQGELKLKTNELAAIKIQGNRVVWLTRTVPGGPVTGGQGPYVPPEGYVLVKIGENNQPQIIVQDWGFTFHPGISIIWSEKFLPELDVKFFFWRRWSAKAGANLEFVDGGISRHIDDFPLCSKFNNVEIQGVGGMSYKGGMRLGIGLRSNL